MNREDHARPILTSFASVEKQAKTQRKDAGMRRRHRKGPSAGRQRDYLGEIILKSSRVEEQTNAEVLYLTRLIQNKTPVLVKLTNNEEIKGWIEYYDRNFIRVTRGSDPNVFIYKDQIKYITEA